MTVDHYIYDTIYNNTINTMEVYNMKNIKEFLNKSSIKYPLAIISAIAIIKTGYDLGSFIIKFKYI